MQQRIRQGCFPVNVSRSLIKNLWKYKTSAFSCTVLLLSVFNVRLNKFSTASFAFMSKSKEAVVTEAVARDEGCGC